MSNEIERFSQPQERGLNMLFSSKGGSAAARRDQTRQVEKAKHDVQMSAFKVDGAAALAGYTMERAVQLDQQRRALSDMDETLNHMLLTIEMTFLEQAKGIQRKLFNDWGF